ncbi:methionine adenosyltransferase [Candidatus Bathyarchaeota archaeon]|nr:methionine adenosyltransferase [Candidatus Bathyarchaeota archaeon]
MNNVFIDELSQVSLEERLLEITERKGLGHPDTMCDYIMNQISIDLSKEYLKKFGNIYHHNLDKGLLAAGETKTSFNGGKVIKPIRIIYGDRATFKINNEIIDVNQIAEESTKAWLRKNIRFIDPELHVIYQSEIKPGSSALQDIFSRVKEGKYLGSNDTSAAVGFAPHTEQEKLILSLEKYLNSKEFKKEHPESGEDIKLMALRKKRDVELTVAMAFVDRYIKSEDDYFKKKTEILEEINSFIDEKGRFNKVNVSLNALDSHGRGLDGLYLTVLGSSVEAGDSGQVGRGNNVRGVIALCRPMSSEAAAGKNPVSHVGKIYNMLCYYIADRIVDEVSGVKETYVWLLSQIGRPINEPSVVSAQIIPEKGVKISTLSTQINEIIADEFEHLSEFCNNLAKGIIGLR